MVDLYDEENEEATVTDGLTKLPDSDTLKPTVRLFVLQEH
jgi:hypothetical protein